MSAYTDKMLDEIAAAIDLPESGYETAKRRYEDVADWFGQPQSQSARHSPRIYPQGSFRLGTVIRPLSADGEYDLDLGCRLERGVTKFTHTQHQLKTMVGHDLDAYRIARRIRSAPKEKHRCWRLLYADDLSFHIDAVPSIPETVEQRQLIENAMTGAGTIRALAKSVADHSGAITDNRLRNYDSIDPSWLVSNSEGYALWFESRMKLAPQLLQERALMAKAHTVDELPAYRWKSPLQRTVQILKRHRDVMFEGNPDSAPISIIITTLAGRAYGGQQGIGDSLRGVLARMGTLVAQNRPRIPNPVNPSEDFADKWSNREYAHLHLEDSFWKWLAQARADFDVLDTNTEVLKLAEHANRRFRTGFSQSSLGTKLGIATAGSLLRSVATPDLSFPNKPLVPTKPAGFAGDE